MTRTESEPWPAGAGRLVALALAALAVLIAAGCRDGSNSRLDELPEDDIIAMGDPTVAEFADIARIVGDGYVPGSTRRAVAQGLVHYIDAVGDAASSQSRDDFPRPEIVALAAELGRDERAAQLMVEAVITWGTERSELLATDPESSTTTAYLPVAMVTAALMHGTDTHDNPALEPADVRSMVLGELQVALAEAFAAETGEEMPSGIPQPGERWDDGGGGWRGELDELIDRATPEGTGNPAIELGGLIHRQFTKYSDPEGDHWQQ